MKTSVGVSTREELLPLIDAGTDEFFCGIVPPEWRVKYAYSLLNRRENAAANFHAYRDLAKAVDLVHRNQRAIYVAFNSLFYSPALYPDLKKVVQATVDLGVDGIIVADLGLLLYLETLPDVPAVVLSGEFGVFNSYALNLLAGLKRLKRITIQRHISVAQIAKLIAGHPQYQYEAFMMNEKCPLVGAHCMASHDQMLFNQDIESNFCKELVDASENFVFNDKEPFAYLGKVYDRFSTEQKKEKFRFLFSVKGRQESQSEVPVHCGLCRLAELKAAGVEYLKIVGRGRPLDLKIKMVKIVNEIMASHKSSAEIVRKYC
jgi:collagenase-like PrtC family protease